MTTGWHTRAVEAPTLRTLTIPAGNLRYGNGPDLDGTFEGYACLWDVTDTYGTRFRPGAWTAGGLDSDPYPLLFMHDPLHVLGQFTAKEDERGLFIAGRYDATPEGQAARARAQSRSAPELSVGFADVPGGVQADDPTAFIAVRLVECSQVTARMASQPGAGLSQVRIGATRLVSQTRYADPPVAGSYEATQRALQGVVQGWANDTYGDRDSDNDWWASIDATFADSVVVTVVRYTPENTRESWRFPYVVQDGVPSLGDPEPVVLVTNVQGGQQVGERAVRLTKDAEERARLGARLRLTEPLRVV